MMRPALSVALVAAMLTAALPAHASWQEDGVPVSTAADDQLKPEAATDGDGGAIIVWADDRAGTGTDIYVQRILDTGVPAWATDGVAACAASGIQFEPRIAATGDGGAVITWWDLRNPDGDIYAQKIDPSGNMLWGPNGVAVCSLSSVQFRPEIAHDGFGGAVITWVDERSGNRDIYAQRLGSSGSAKWTLDGVAVCGDTASQTLPWIAGDGTAGVVISWMDFRNAGDRDIYAQKLDANGVAAWIANGRPVVAAAGEQWYAKQIFDGHNGVIFAWYDTRNGASNQDIFAQRLALANGLPLWAAGGVPVCVAPRNQRVVDIVPDGAFGAILAWEDSRTFGSVDVYAQRIDLSGDTLWAADGIAVSAASGDQELPRMAPDGSGGAYVVWNDSRGSIPTQGIYGQHLDPNGNALFAVDGEVVATSFPTWWPVVVADEDGDAVVAWQDSRSGGKDIYAQCLAVPTLAVGGPDAGAPGPRLHPVVPNPFVGATRIAFEVPDGGAPVRLSIHDVAGRRVRTLEAGARRPGRQTMEWDGLSDAGARVAPGLYFVRLAVGGGVRARSIVLSR